MATLSFRRSLNDYDKVRLNDCTMYVHKNYRNPALEKALAVGEKALAEEYHLDSIKSSKFARIFKFAVEFSECTRKVFYKEYLYRSVWDFAKHIFRPSRANRAFQASLMLRENGFNVPEIIAFGEEKNRLLCKRNFLLTREVEGAQQLHLCIGERCQDLTKETIREKRRLIKAFGQIIGKMHADGIFHGDLRLGNILARENNSGWQFFFLDNERTQKFLKLPSNLRLKNIVQVNMFRENISSTDRLRFLRAYFGEKSVITTERKGWANKITVKTNRRLIRRDKLCPR